ncbi:MAG: gliding motility-associated ABC transporter ATP-binding subunit GldA [Puia sp.]|nr:gliding motility-associated ABC transporter ATP-binding subunit GldA [Puia sp.]
MSIEVKDLVKIYGEQKAVDTISFKVGKGEIVGFLGPNGAGKSTTMKIITGYLRQDGGEVSVCGIPVNDQATETKKKIGYLPEANPLYYDMYVREYLAFIAAVHRLDNRKDRIEESIRRVGLTLESRKKLGQLSKGYKQRAGLAAALVHDPEVLILDEPTTGLDPNQILEIREVIRDLGRNKTVLFSSHILQEVEAVCDRVVIINKGRLVADSSLDDLRRTDSNIIKVHFKESVHRQQLEALEGVRSVNNTDSCHWELESGDPGGVKKQLLELALQNNLNIVSLQSEEKSLEDSFRRLTNGQ